MRPKSHCTKRGQAANSTLHRTWSRNSLRPERGTIRRDLVRLYQSFGRLRKTGSIAQRVHGSPPLRRENTSPRLIAFWRHGNMIQLESAAP
jgi:hypothetical protein